MKAPSFGMLRKRELKEKQTFQAIKSHQILTFFAKLQYLLPISIINASVDGFIIQSTVERNLVNLTLKENRKLPVIFGTNCSFDKNNIEPKIHQINS